MTKARESGAGRPLSSKARANAESIVLPASSEETVPLKESGAAVNFILPYLIFT